MKFLKGPRIHTRGIGLHEGEARGRWRNSRLLQGYEEYPVRSLDELVQIDRERTAAPYFPATSLICHRPDVDGENSNEFGIAVNKSELQDRELEGGLILFSRVR